MNDNILGVMVTYNPDMQTLHSDIDAVLSQVETVLVYDNASKNQNELKHFFEQFPTVRFFANNENNGLPKCYNSAMRYGMRGGYSWLLILDQDTVLPKDFLIKAANLFDDEAVALIAPIYWDINAFSREEFEKNIPREKVSFVKRCISSGSLVKISTLKQLGGFDEAMFIDYVDYDYCRTVIDSGYKIVRLNECVMAHQIGNSRAVSLFGRPQIIHNHSAIRKYYFFRNRVYYARKHHLKLRDNKRFYKGFVKLLVLVFYEEHPFGKFRKSLKGMLDGMHMPISDIAGGD